MQKHRSKLALGRETVRILQPSHLRAVAGGMTISGGHVTNANGDPPATTTGKHQPISILTE